jgi:hypothetical protein
LKGRGSSAEQRRLSLQDDLAALTSTRSRVLDPSLWPHLQCLTALRFTAVPPSTRSSDAATAQHERALYKNTIQCAVNATSLVKLEFCGLKSSEDFPILAHLSNLRSLTHLSIDCELGQPSCSAVLQAGINPLSRLKQLALLSRPSRGDNLPPLHLALPSSLLPCLTTVQLRGFSLDSSQPMVLGAAQELELGSCTMDSLEALSACPHLTRLVHTSRGRNHEVGPSSSFPAHWREGLRSLEWLESNAGTRTLAWVGQLQGLTSLSLQVVSMTPAFFRCGLGDAVQVC